MVKNKFMSMWKWYYYYC